MKTQLTPGEWKYGIRDDGSMWLSLGDPLRGPHYQGDLVASVADADLIVAAPKLLEMCKLAAHCLREEKRTGTATLLEIVVSYAEGKYSTGHEPFTSPNGWTNQPK